MLWARSDDQITLQSKVINKQKEIAIVLLSPDLSKRARPASFYVEIQLWVDGLIFM